MSEFLYSYTDFINERKKFIQVDHEGVNRYDSPANLYFKLMFYFTDDSGLLGISNVSEDKNSVVETIKNTTAAFKGKEESITSIKNNVFTNTAYNYLLLNDELERAEYLKNFVMLLSDINCDSPWYFQEINGLDAALERKVFTDSEFKIEDSRKQITIKCLHDAFDNRIGTLLDLYRAACFSYQNKKEIVPANLRKFNMGILVFNAPVRGKGGKSGDAFNRITIPDDSNGGIKYYYIPSVKLIELRNCELDYNSSKSAFGTLNNSEEFTPEYTITINFDDCYESRYNEILQEVVTDFINIDINKERIENSLKPGELINISSFGISDLSDKQDIRISKATKDYWVNTDLSEDNLYTTKAINNTKNSTESLNFPGKNLLTTQINKIGEKIDKVTQIPSLKIKNENIHDNGTVNMYGEFEYLNRLNGTNGVVGGVLSQSLGIPFKYAKDKISKLYLGNIYKMSVRDIVSSTSKLLTGDVAGVASDIHYNPKSSSKEIKKDLNGKSLPDYPGQRDIDGELKDILPGYSGWQNTRTKFLTKTNEAKSLRNNL